MRSITRSDLTGRSVVELRVLAAIFNRLLLAAPPLSADWHAAATTLDTIKAERDRRLHEVQRIAV
jgi:hypothetical protein